MKVNWTTTLHAITAGAAVAIAIIALLALDFAQHHVQQSEAATRLERLEVRLGDYESARFVDVRKSLATARMDAANQRLRPYDAGHPPEAMLEELTFCDDLGLRVYRGDLNRHDVWDVFSTWLFVLYRDAQPAIDAARRDGAAASFGDCTDLVESLEDIEVAENGNPRMVHPSDDFLYRFYASEANAQPGEPPKSRVSLRQK